MFKTKHITTAAAIASIAIMLTCCLVPVVDSAVSNDDGITASERETYKYVSTGDSMTTGYGLFGYYGDDGKNYYGFLKEDPDTYSEYLTTWLQEQLPDKDVKHVQLGYSGTRSTEIRALLYDSFTGSDGFPGDKGTFKVYADIESTVNAYNLAMETYPEIAAKYSYDTVIDDFNVGKFDMLQEIYQTEFADADLITLSPFWDVGWIGSSFKNIFDEGSFDDKLDFNLYCNERIADMALKMKTALREYLLELIGGDSTTENVIRIVDSFVTGATYAVVGYCENTDAISEWVYEHNEDAKIIIIDPYDVTYELNLELGDGISIDISYAYKILFDFCNTYTTYLSPFALKNYHVSIDYVPTLMGYEFRTLENEDISDEAKADLMCVLGYYSGYAQADAVVEYDKLNSYGNMYKLMHYIFSSSNYDSEYLFDRISDGINSLFTEAMEKKDLAMSVIGDENADVVKNQDGSVTVYKDGTEITCFSYTELSLLHLNLLSFAKGGVLDHPSHYAHEEIVAAIEQVITDHDILGDGRSMTASELVEYLCICAIAIIKAPFTYMTDIIIGLIDIILTVAECFTGETCI